MVKITVIMPVYNAEKYLPEAIKSVLKQTYNNFEFIIVDDGSKDGSIKIIESFFDKRIKLIKLQHGGVVTALNFGLKISQGEYIVRMDADDISIPYRFEKLLTYMEKNKEVGMCGSWANVIDEKGKVIREMTYPPIENNKIKRYALLRCPFIHPSVIIRKTVFDSVGEYKNFKDVEDYELWTRILRKYEAHNLPEFLLKYRIHNNQVSNKNNLRRRLVGAKVRLLAIIRYLL